jgi:hypothetical protein
MARNKQLQLAAAILFALALARPGTAMTASDKEEYERRGLSQVEWEMILDARMPRQKLDELQKSGISITEYFKYPWLNYGLTEKQWIARRTSGQMESEIKQDTRPGSRAEGAVVTNFFVPGLHQFQRKQYLKASIMSGAAAFAVLYMAGRSLATRAFVPGPLFILLPAMLWSSVDIGVQINQEGNPDASRFSTGKPAGRDICYSICIVSNRRTAHLCNDDF